MKIDIFADMGEPVAGIGYQWSDASGLTGSRITAGIQSPSPGVYAAYGVTPPAGTVAITWSDGTGLKTATEGIDGTIGSDDSPHETARRLIVEHFTDNWPETFPVAHENQPLPDRVAVYGMFSVQQAATTSPVVGRGHERGTGMLFLSVFIAEGHGTKAATDAADWMRRFFDNQQFREGAVVVTMALCGMNDVGPRSGYVQKNIVCRFTRDCYPSL